MLMMLGHHDPNVAYQSSLGATKKLISNTLACKVTDLPTARRENDTLAGEFRAGTTILITDLCYRVGTQSGTHGIQMGVGDMGWEDLQVFLVHESDEERPIQKFIDTIEKTKRHLKEIVDDGRVTVHIWLSLQFLHAARPPHNVILENDFTDRFVKGIVDLDQEVSRPVIVAINNDSMFNGLDSITSRKAVELIEALRLQGILVTSDQRMRRSMYSQFGSQYSILSSSKGGSLGKTAIWAIIEKNLFRQRVFLMCATVREHMPEKSGVSKSLLENVTGPTEAFMIAGGEMTKGDYAADDSTIFQKGPPTGSNPNRFTRGQRYKTNWVEPMVGTQDLEPAPTERCHWYPLVLCGPGGLRDPMPDMPTSKNCRRNRSMSLYAYEVHQLLGKQPRPLQASIPNPRGQTISAASRSQIEGGIRKLRCQRPGHQQRVSSVADICGISDGVKCTAAIWGEPFEVAFSHGRSEGFKETGP